MLDGFLTLHFFQKPIVPTTKQIRWTALQSLFQIPLDDIISLEERGVYNSFDVWSYDPTIYERESTGSYVVGVDIKNAYKNFHIRPLDHHLPVHAV